MSNNYYTIEQLWELLKSPEISDNFRKAIIMALEDGSDAAIRSLCPAHATAFTRQEVGQDLPQVHE